MLVVVVVEEALVAVEADMDADAAVGMAVVEGPFARRRRVSPHLRFLLNPLHQVVLPFTFSPSRLPKKLPCHHRNRPQPTRKKSRVISR